MAVRDIISIPDPQLRKVSAPVERLDDEVQKLLDDMAETMYDAPGIGLAAIQLGIPLRIFVADVAERAEKEDGPASENEAGMATEPAPLVEPEKKPIFFINPEIVELSGEPSIYNEGCLSIPDYYAEVERPSNVAIKFLDRDGKEQMIEAEGLLSTCIQHEFDHLEGKLFIDLLSKLKRDMVIRKFTKIAKQSGKVF